MVVVDVGVQRVRTCRYVLVVYGVAVLVFRQALFGVSVAESCRDAVLPACLHANVCAEHSVVGEVGIGQIGQLVFYRLEIWRRCRDLVYYIIVICRHGKAAVGA